MIMGALACLIASMSWGAMFPVADHALEYIDPFYFSFIRYGAVAIILVLLLLMKEGKKAFRLEGKGKLLVFFGTMAFTVYNVLVFLGQMMMGKPGVMVASIMEALMPMISICILWGYKHIKPKKYMITSMVIAFVGAVFVITKGDMSFFLTLKDNLFSLAFIFIGVVGWVVYTMGGQVFSDWSTLRYSTLTCVFGTAVTGVITIIITMLGYVPVPSAEILSIVKYDLLFMMTLPGIVALLAWNYGVKILSSINGILFINFVPITTLVIMMMQGYKITTFDIVGTLLVMTALIRNNVCQRKEESKNKQVLQEEPLRRAV
ncbi:EamA/RhaT family transporter [Bacillus cereus]|uniref:EamA/RhaT family transporter n=2 Tax=Bacillus TaxID=1386 RepID=A0AA44QAN9_BACCE|nr:EamA/RhaT family transporter [Bacillus cereus]PFN06916.1 EamA/RhaT family transporter [Bacillus cereus]PFO83754.1 EamA/RhaT family transporter [Bacillus cereus]PFR31932.1 EamA/RhaT family transporter [Bacillus cereus]PFS01496.1 EamA/RhaT family transporter [Bacillus cereus]